jgi:hypothetical protein
VRGNNKAYEVSSLFDGRFLKADGETFHQKGKLVWYLKGKTVTVKPQGYKPIGNVLKDSIWPDMWVSVDVWNRKEFRRYWNENTPDEIKLKMIQTANKKPERSKRGDSVGNEAWTLEEVKAVSSEQYEQSKFKGKRKRAVLGPIVRGIVWIKSNGICFYCEIKTVFEGPKNFERSRHDFFTVDHKKPVDLGGGESPTNLVGCCNRCNMMKKNMTEEEFRRRFAKYLIERKKEWQAKRK